jgi:hypothetical protein
MADWTGFEAVPMEQSDRVCTIDRKEIYTMRYAEGEMAAHISRYGLEART